MCEVRRKSYDQNTSQFLYPSIGRTKEGVECPRKEDDPWKGEGEPPVNKKPKKVMCVQDLNRDEVGIPMLSRYLQIMIQWCAMA
jgi:hypothetical protein